MTRQIAPLIALATGAAMVLAAPAHAHGVAGGGASAGFLHPLAGLDHLVMLVAVGTAAAFISSRLLFWALGGAVIGAGLGLGGLSLPAAEVLAALSVSAVAALTLLAARLGRGGKPGLLGVISASVVALGVAIHALLHGLEAPQQGNSLLWWSGALVSSALVCSGTTVLLRRLPLAWSRTISIAALISGGLLALAALAGLHSAPAGA